MKSCFLFSLIIISLVRTQEIHLDQTNLNELCNCNSVNLSEKDLGEKRIATIGSKTFQNLLNRDTFIKCNLFNL